MIDLKQIKKDFDEGVIVCHPTLVKLVDYALELEAEVDNKLPGIFTSADALFDAMGVGDAAPQPDSELDTKLVVVDADRIKYIEDHKEIFCEFEVDVFMRMCKYLDEAINTEKRKNEKEN